MAETLTVEQPWAVRFRDGMWEVTCSDGSLGGRFPREGDARTFADVAGPGPMTIVSVAELERLREELRQADAFGRGEFRVTQWAYDQAVRVMNERGAAIERVRDACKERSELDHSRGWTVVATHVLAALDTPTAE